MIDDRLNKTPLNEPDKKYVKKDLIDVYNKIQIRLTGNVTDNNNIIKLYGLFVEGFIGGFITSKIYNLEELLITLNNADADK